MSKTCSGVISFFDNKDINYLYPLVPPDILPDPRYLLFKSRNNWTLKQSKRAEILFREFPDLEKAYNLSDKLRKIYSHTKDKGVAYTKLAHWYKDVEESGFKSFGTIAETIKIHYKNILNFFDNRSTNASAESFNAKLKAFRRTQRGVNDMKFFLFRVSKIFAYPPLVPPNILPDPIYIAILKKQDSVKTTKPR